MVTFVSEPEKIEQEAPQSPFCVNRDEIYYNLINSLLTGLLAFLGAVQIGGAYSLAFCLGAVAFIIRFKAYWDKQEAEYRNLGVFCFF